MIPGGFKAGRHRSALLRLRRRRLVEHVTSNPDRYVPVKVLAELRQLHKAGDLNGYEPRADQDRGGRVTPRPTDLRRLDDEAFVPADPVQGDGRGVRRHHYRQDEGVQAEPGALLTRDVPGSRAAGGGALRGWSYPSAPPAPVRGQRRVLGPGASSSSRSTASGPTRSKRPRRETSSTTQQFRVRELQADAPVRDFVFTPVRDAEEPASRTW